MRCVWEVDDVWKMTGTIVESQGGEDQRLLVYVINPNQSGYALVSMTHGTAYLCKNEKEMVYVLNRDLYQPTGTRVKVVIEANKEG